MQPSISRGEGRPRRSSRQAGNTFIETALVLLPLFALLFAIIDYGFAVFLRSTFQHAAREGVRYAVTYQTKQGMGHDDSIKSIVQNNAMGFLGGTTGKQYIQIQYYKPDTLLTTTANSPGNLVEVSISGYKWGWVAPLWRSNTPLAINARSSDRMEGLPGGTQPPAR